VKILASRCTFMSLTWSCYLQLLARSSIDRKRGKSRSPSVVFYLAKNFFSGEIISVEIMIISVSLFLCFSFSLLSGLRRAYSSPPCRCVLRGKWKEGRPIVGHCCLSSVAYSSSHLVFPVLRLDDSHLRHLRAHIMLSSSLDQARINRIKRISASLLNRINDVSFGQ